MIVHVTGSLANVDEDITYLRRIVKIIKQNDSTLALDWIESAYIDSGKDATQQNPEPDWQTIMEETLDAIGRADVVIVEATHYTFSQGFQAAMALNQKKPVLIVLR